MNTFKFDRKVFRVVEDRVGELVAGCKRCAFSGSHDLRCSQVDGGDTGRVRCSEGNHHYEEVKHEYLPWYP